MSDIVPARLKLGLPLGCAVADDMANIREAAPDAGPRPGRGSDAGSVLPQLTGWKFAVFRAVWVFALALAVGGTIAGLHYHKAWYGSVIRPIEDLGLQIARAPVLGPPLGSQAREAGIVPGLRLIAIDGRALPPDGLPVETTREIAARLERPEGAQVRVQTRSPEGLVRDHLLTKSRGHVVEAYRGSGISHEQRRLIELIADLAATTVNVAAAVLLFRRRARDPVAAMLSLAFLLLAANTGPAWYMLMGLGVPQVAYVAGAIGWGALFVGVAVFPEGRLETRWRRVLVAATGLWVLAYLAAVARLVDLPGGFFDLSGILLITASVASLGARYRRLSFGVARQQIRWAFLGFAVGAGLGSAVIVAGILTGSDPVDPASIWFRLLLWIVGSIAFSFLALGLLISLLKYRLYDADAAISRSAGYAVLTLLLGATFAASAKGVEWVFEAYFGDQAGALPGAVGAGLAVVLITPMHRRVQDWAERRFQKALLHLRRDLPQCVDDLRETAGLDALLDEVLARVEAGTRAVRSAVTIDGQRVAARGDDGGYPLAVPLRVGHQQAEIGVLLVGPRPDGSAPGPDEREALAEIADPVARAMRIVLLREAREAKDEARFAALEVAMARLLGQLKPGTAAGC